MSYFTLVDECDVEPEWLAMATVKRKVRSYVTNNGRLLVFRQPHCLEDGLQVPGGTVEANEAIVAAARREIFEESGLINLRLAADLGVRRWRWQQWLHVQSYLHFVAEGTVPETWRHYERHASDGSGPHLFEFFWVDSAEIPALSAANPYFFCLASAVV